MDGQTKPSGGMSQERRQLFELLLKRKGLGATGAAGADTIPRRTDVGSIPLSFAQQQLWFLDRWVPESPLYTMPDAMRLVGSLDVGVLEQSLNEIVQRHEALRTIFTAVEGRPAQIILPALHLDVPVIDLQATAADQQDIEAQRLALAEMKRPFDLAVGPLIRASLLKLNPHEHILILLIHHIVADGWSLGVLYGELVALYKAYSTGETSHLSVLPIQYADYAAWQRSDLQHEKLSQQLDYWRQQLADAPAALNLLTDHPRPAIESFRGTIARFTFPQRLLSQLQALSQQESATLFMTLLAAFDVLLYRYSGQQDLVVGSPIANRTRSELEGMIGLFVNTLVFRARLDDNQTFRQLLHQVRETAKDAYAHQDLPFERLVEEMQPERDVSRQSLFQVVFQLQNMPRQRLELPGLTFEPVEVQTGTAKFDLSLYLAENQVGGLNGLVEYNTDLFESETIARLLGHYQRLLEGIVAEPDAPIATLPLLSDMERQQLLMEWNATTTPDISSRCIHHVFEEQAQRTPQKVAVVCGATTLTYQQLEQCANQLAWQLQQLGVGPDVFVGVCLERSAELIIGILGILKAGGAYVPLDPNYPVDRLAFMLQDIQAPLVLTTQRLRASLPTMMSAQVLCIDAAEDVLRQHPTTAPVSTVMPQHLAYVIYTSGSTGTPKGVLITHSNVVHSTAARLQWYREPVTGFLLLSSVAFDSSVAGIMGTLCQGGQLVLPAAGSERDPEQLLYLIQQHAVSHLLCLPSLHDLLLSHAQAGQLASLRTVIVAGEACPTVLFTRHRQVLGATSLVNEYGPTEGTVWSSAYECQDAIAQPYLPIGRPIPNVRLYLLDQHMQVVPIGVAGEIYIAGAGLARGYHQRPELTAERFVPNPFSQQPGERLYRTGDLACYLADGNIAFLGRTDAQVKIRGYRIELGEIEEALRHHPGVRDCTVIAHEDAAGEKRLVAYVVLSTPDTAALNSATDRMVEAAQTEKAVEQAEDEQVGQWHTIFDKVYRAAPPDTTAADAAENYVGWVSSYTGEPIPAEQMRVWADETVARIRAHNPQRILEIGCGNGLLLLRLAANCAAYYGTDISDVAIQTLAAQLGNSYPQVHLSQRAADNFSGLESETFDTAILNSVVQYFPSIDYLLQVLLEIGNHISSDGLIFIGDVRSLPLQEAFATSVELAQAPDALPIEQLLRRVRKRLTQEAELLIDPGFFFALQQHYPQFQHIQVQLKRGRADNEMNSFRYDVVLHIGSEMSPVMPGISAERDWQRDELTLPSLRTLLAEEQPAVLALTGVPNARVVAALQAQELLANAKHEHLRTVGALRTALQDKPEVAPVHPEDFWALAAELSYDVEILWAGTGAEQYYTVLLRRCSEAAPSFSATQETWKPGHLSSSAMWSDYANNPLQEQQARQVIPHIRSYLQSSLPEYMIPAAFVALSKLPRTPNGKLDRKALPAPDQTRPELETTYVMPRNELELSIAAIWQDVLHIEQVGVHDNFFDLGGHSLLMVQVHSKLHDTLHRDLSIIDLFRFPTVSSLAHFLSPEAQMASASASLSTSLLNTTQTNAATTARTATRGIALVGMAGRFPGAQNIEAFWRNLCDGEEAISFFTDTELLMAGVSPHLLQRPEYVRASAVLKDVDLFDAPFFGFTAREAEITNPHQRVFMECAWEALENAGCDPETYTGRIGVYAGSSTNTYLNNIASHPDLVEAIGGLGGSQATIANLPDYLTTRVSYKLGLKGPSVNVYTACSTSLVAVHLACQALAHGECEMALAGGVSIRIPQETGYLYQEGGILSPDGHCRPFDAQAQGTLNGNAVGVVVLKPLEQALEDGDTVYAVIKGWAINNDGADKVGYTAPGVNGQAQVIAAALAMADVSPGTITYVETHGTATPLGDPIEVAGLTQAYRTGTQDVGYCAIGSLKSNYGHLNAAAGVAGLIKTTLALKHGVIPPSLHFEQPNPAIDFASTPFYVNAALTAWPQQGEAPRRAGVSSFGIGGTNAHVILEEAPPIESNAAQHLARPYQMLLLSARTPTALETMTTHLAEHLKEHVDVDFAALAYTLQAGRKAFNHRRILVCQHRDDAIAALEAPTRKPVFTGQRQTGEHPVVFLFPGQGAQYVRMGHDLYQSEPLFREQVDHCVELLKPLLGLDLRELLYPQDGQSDEATRQLTQTALTQPALFVIEYALSQLWMSWGIRPQAMIGHSIGEYVAACLAGVFSLEDALALVAERGRLMQSLPAGAMLVIPLPEQQVQPLLTEQLSLATINSPAVCVASGPIDAIAALEQELTQQGVECRRAHTSHAFHSAMMDPILEPFARRVQQIRLQPPTLPYLSNVTGTWITDDQATDPWYWATHLRQTVRFAAGAQQLLREPKRIFLEVGPGQTLSTLVRQHPDHAPEQLVLASMRHPQEKQSDVAALFTAMGRLWSVGVPIAWDAFAAGRPRKHIPLPTYPFERKRYWVELASRESAQAQTQTLQTLPLPLSQPMQTLQTLQALSTPEFAHMSQNGANGFSSSTATLTASPSLEEVIMPQLPTPATSKTKRQEQIAEKIVAILANLLGESPANFEDVTFLEAGASSLVLLQFSQALHDAFGVKVAFRDLFEQIPTIPALAAYLDTTLPPEIEQPEPQVAAPVATAIAPLPAAPPPALPIATTSVASPTQPSFVAPAIANNSTLENLFAQQLQVMSQQLELLRGMPASSVATVQANQVTQNANTPPVSAAAPALALQATPRAPVMQTIPAVSNATPEVYIPYQPVRIAPTSGLTERQQQHLRTLIERYTQRTQESKRLTQAHRAHLADSRVVSGFRPDMKEIVYPLITQRSQGSRVWDVDGNEYIDLTMGFGVHLFGHSPDFIKDALVAQLNQGVELGPQSYMAGEVARLICAMTGVERVTFTNSGTEAVMAALRMVRAVTGRDKVVLFAGAYHGTFDGVLAIAQRKGDTSVTVPMAPGILSHMVEDVLVLDYDSPRALEIIREHGHEIAAVLVEPVQSRRPDLQPGAFLRQLRELTEQIGAALIFDEIITGFRIHQGGAQALFGVQADLVTYGKVVGGGMPIGVVAGKSRYMDAMDGGMWSFGDASYPRAEQTMFAGTFCKHPLAMAAALAVLHHMQDAGTSLQEQLNARATRLVGRLNSFFEQKRLPIHMVQFGSLFRFVFARELKYTDLFLYHMSEHGVYIWEGRNCFLSTAHSEEDIEAIFQAVQASIAELQVGGFLPDFPPDDDPTHSNGTNGHSRIDTPVAIQIVNSGQSGQGYHNGAVAAASANGMYMDGKLPLAQEFPLTDAQKQLWFLVQLGDDASRAYNEFDALALRGELDVAALQYALQEVVTRHDALRTTFDASGDMQRVAPALAADLSLVSLANLPEVERAARVEHWLAEERAHAFDLATGPLWRAHLLKLSETEHIFIFMAHHIIADGWSIGIVMSELRAFYATYLKGEPVRLPPAMQFSQYATWMESYQHSAEMTAAETYWLAHLAAPLPVLELPTDHPRPVVQSYSGGHESLTIGLDLYEQLKQFSKQQRCTLFTALLATFQVLLYRLTAQDDLIIGVPSAGQVLVNGPDLVGHCVNMLPMRSKLQGDQTVAEHLHATQKLVLDAFEHQGYSFVNLVNKLHVERDTSRPPVFSVIFNLDQPQAGAPYPGLEVQALPNPASFAKFDLHLNIGDMGNKLLLEANYNTDLIESSTIQRWLGYFQTLLESLIAHTERPLATLPLLPATEYQQLIDEWNNTDTPYPQESCLHELFQAQAEQMPTATAVTFAGTSLTYHELNQRANQLAHRLQRLGIGPDKRVGLCLDRSIELAVALLGVLKAGGAYVPLDPHYPKERLHFMLTDAQVPVLLTQEHLLTELPPHQATTLCLDTNWTDLATEAADNPPQNTQAENLAYVIYTSGSTGTPKGVAMPHRPLVNLFSWQLRQTQLPTGAKTVQFTSPSFDVACQEFFCTWLAGGTLALVAEELRSDALQLLRFLHSEGIERLFLPFVALQQLAEAAAEEPALTFALREVITAGEQLQITPQIADFFTRMPQCELYNQYGPAECHVVTDYQLTGAPHTWPTLAPIGRPIANATIYLLDGQLQPVPIGVTGNLYIGGRAVAHGYLNRPDLTADRFVPDHFSKQPGARLYKTGDLARYHADGTIQFLGRADQQVKIRGYRIEPGEVEAVLNAHPLVREGAVVPLADEQIGHQGQRLVAYLASAGEAAHVISEVRAYMKERLPSYMLPAAFVVLPTLPLTPSGKVDRRALPAPDASQRPEMETTYSAPQNALEQAIVAAWQDILNIERVGVHDNFFDLGGHSLLLVRLRARLQGVLPKEVSIIDLFKYPTVSLLAAYVSQADDMAANNAVKQQTQQRGLSRREAMQRQRAFRQQHRGTQSHVDVAGGRHE